jgi:hypothetical protein
MKVTSWQVTACRRWTRSEGVWLTSKFKLHKMRPGWRVGRRGCYESDRDDCRDSQIVHQFVPAHLPWAAEDDSASSDADPQAPLDWRHLVALGAPFGSTQDVPSEVEGRRLLSAPTRLRAEP